MKKYLIAVLFLISVSSLFSADRYWVGGGSSNAWNATTPTNWSATSGGGNDASVPASGDNVYFNTNSGVGVSNLSANITIRSLNCTGYAGTIQHTAGVTLSIGDASAGASNIALKFVSGMTYTLGDSISSAIDFIASHGTQQTVDFAGKTTGNVSFKGNTDNSSWIYQGAHNIGVTATVALTRGLLNTNGFACSWGAFVGVATTARTLTLGTSTITLTGVGTIWDCSNPSGTALTLTTNASTIIILDTSASAKIFAGAGKTTYNNVTFSGDNITVTGSNAYTGIVSVSNAGLATGLLFTSGTTQTISYFTTNGSVGSLAIIKSTVGGSVATLTKASGGVSVDYMSIQDIATTGAATWYAGANSTNVSGNSGWNFTAPPGRYWVGGGSSSAWSATGPTNWSATSGGPNNASIPASTDDVFFDDNSGAGVSVLSANITIRSLNCSGFIGTLQHDAGVTLSIGDATAGVGSVALKFASGMTYTLGNIVSSAINFTTSNASVQIVDFAGKTTANVSYSSSSNNGSWIYHSVHNTGVTATVTLNRGTVNTNGFSASWGFFSTSAANTRILNLGASIITIKGVGTVWECLGTLNANTSTIIISDTSANAKTFAGAGKTYRDVIFSGDNITVTGSNTYNNLSVNNAGLPNGLKLDSAYIQTTVASFLTNGFAGNLAKLASTTATAAKINKSSGTVNVDYMLIRNIDVSGVSVWNAGANCVDDGDGNLGWIFAPAARYWVGGGSSNAWNAVGPSNWSNTSGGTNGYSRPSSSYDVFFDENSLGTCVLSANTTIRSLNCSGFTGTLQHDAGVKLTIGQTTAVTGSNALKFATSMTYTLGDPVTSAIEFTSAGIFRKIDFASKTTGNVSYVGTTDSSTWVYQGVHNTGTTATVTLSRGVLNTNDFDVSWGLFAIGGANTRSLTLGASTVTMTGVGIVWNGPQTLPANTSTIIISNTSANAKTFAGASLATYNNVVFSGNNITVTGNNTYSSLSINTAGLAIGLKLTAGSIQSTTNFSTNGFAGNLAKLASTSATPAKINKISGTVSVDYMNLENIDVTFGTSVWFGEKNCVDSGGNLGWMFQGLLRYWVGGGTSANWDATGPTNWSMSSGGANDAPIPGPNDDVFFDDNSGALNSFISNHIAIRSLNCTNYRGTLTHNAGVKLSIGKTNGNWGYDNVIKFVEGMTYTLGNPSTSEIEFVSTIATTQTIDFSGKQTGNIVFNSAVGSWRFLGEHNTSNAATVTLTNGTVDTNGRILDWGHFISSNGTLTLGSSYVTIKGTGVVWDATGLTLTANTSTINVSDTSVVTKTFNGANKANYNLVIFSGDNIVVTGSNTFKEISVQNAGLPNGLILASGATQTVKEFSTNGSVGSLAIIKSDTSGVATTISKDIGRVSVDYMSIQDMTAATTNNAVWYAGANSIDISNNTGWIFTRSAGRYWVGGGSNNTWAATSPTNWSTSSGGLGDASVPTSSDDVFFDSNSGSGVSVIDANITIRSLNTTGYIGTLQHNASVSLSIGDSVSGANGIALKFDSAMTYTLGHYSSSNITFASTSTAVQSVDFAGKTTGDVSYNGVGASWKLTGPHSQNNAQTSLANGTLNTNGQTCNWGGFSSNNGNIRTLTMGNSLIHLRNTLPDASNHLTNVWACDTVTNFTITPNSATVTIYAMGKSRAFRSGGKDWNGLSLVFVNESGGYAITNFTTTGGVLKNLTIIGAGNPLLEDIYVVVGQSNNFTVTNNLTFTGYSASRRLTVMTGAINAGAYLTFPIAQKTINITGVTVNCSNVDFRNIVFSSSNLSEIPVDLSAIPGGSGDLGGNSGITFTTGVPLYWHTPTSGTKLWSDTNNWFFTTGGVNPAHRVPLPQDHPTFDANSFGATNTIVYSDLTKLGKNINWTGVNNNPEWHIAINIENYGDFILDPNMTMTCFDGLSTFYMTGYGISQTVQLSTQGVVFPMNVIWFNADISSTTGVPVIYGVPSKTNSVIFGSDFNGNTTNTTGLYVAGIGDLNGKNVTLGQLKVSSNLGNKFIMGSGHLKITGADGTNPDGNFAAAFMPQGMIDASAGTSILELCNNTPFAQTLFGSDKFNSVIISGSGNNVYTFSGSITCNEFTDTKTVPHTLKFLGGSNTTFNGSISVVGSAGNVVTVTSTNATPFTWSKAAGVVSCDYLFLSQSTATGGATFNAGANTIDGGGNTGWLGLNTNIFTWTGATNNNWSVNTNWQGNIVPSVNDIAYFTGTSVVNCTIDANCDVKGLRIGVGYTGTITQATEMTIGTEGFDMLGGNFHGGTQAINNSGFFSHSGGFFKNTRGTHQVTAQGQQRGTWIEKAGNATDITFDHNYGTIKVVGSLDAIVNSIHIGTSGGITGNPAIRKFYHLDLDTTGAVSGQIYVLGNLTRTQSGALDASISLAGDYLGTGIGGSSDGTGVLTFIGTNTLASQIFEYPYAPSVVIDKNAASTLEVNNDVQIGGNWAHTGGLIQWNNHKVTFENAGNSTIANGSFYDLEINKSASSEVSISNLGKVSHHLTITSLAQLKATNISGNLEVAGDYTTNDAFWGGTSKLIFTGGTSNTITGNGKQGVSIEVNKPSGSLKLFTDLELPNVGNDLIVRSGNLDLNTFDLSVANKLTVYDTMTLSGLSSQVITVNGATSIATSSDFTLSATSSTIIYSDGAGTAVVTDLKKTFYNLTLGGGKVHEFATGVSNGITVNGTLASNGSNLNRSILRSLGDASTDWELTLNGTSTLADKVSVKHSDASSGLSVLAINSIDKGNNTNWFGLTELPIITSITSSTANGSYKAGSAISVSIAFNKSITLTGSLTINLNSGGSVLISSFTGSSASGVYTVGNGQTTDDLTATSVVITGTARDASSNDLTTTLPAINIATGSDIKIDTTVPTILSATLAPDNSYVEIIFSEAVFAEISGNGGLLAEDFTASFASNGGTATGVTISSVKTVSNTATVGGETSIRLYLSIIGQIAGVETVTITPVTSSVFDKAGNAALSSTTTGSLTLKDLSAPTITDVTSSASNGKYNTGTIPIQVVFSEPVIVTDKPTLTLETGVIDRVAVYSSGSSSNTLVFTYTIQSGDISSNLDYQSTAALSLAGGTIKDLAGNNAVLTLPAPGAAHSLGANKAIAIDTISPNILNSTIAVDGSYIDITMSEGVFASTSGGGLDADDFLLVFASNGGLITSAKISSARSTTDTALVGGESLIRLTLDLEGTISGVETVTIKAKTNSIFDGFGNVMSDTQTTKTFILLTTGGASTIPTVTNVSSINEDGLYFDGSSISLQVMFSEVVTVSGTPTLSLNVGTNRYAVYSSGSGTDTLTFTYLIAIGDKTSDLDYENVTSLATGSGLIKSLNSIVADINLPIIGSSNSLGGNKNIEITTDAPKIVSISTSKANGTYGVGAIIPIQVTLNKPVTLSGGSLIAKLNNHAIVTIDEQSGSSITILYVVGKNEEVDKLDVVSLELSSGASIMDASGRSLDVSFPPNSFATLFNIKIGENATSTTPGKKSGGGCQYNSDANPEDSVQYFLLLAIFFLGMRVKRKYLVKGL